ncbi:ABC transporter permease subunit [Paenibacillus glucanolyticus]
MKNFPLWIGGILLAFFVFVMLAGPYMPFIDKDLKNEPSRWVMKDGKQKLTLPPYKPSSKNWLGSDKRGVDNLSKLVVTAKDTILLVLAITAARYAIGVPLGLIARKKKGFTYQFITFWNQMCSYLPPVFASALLLALPFFLFSQQRMGWAILILASVEAGRVAITIQQQAHKMASEPYMEAGTALGLRTRTLTKNYYIPVMFPEVIVNFCLDMGKVMLLLGQLAIVNIFLGHEWKEVNYYVMEFVETGYNWATILSKNRADIWLGKFQFVVYPAFAMMLLIITFNLLGEGLRRRFQVKG